jgi:hypothetical protein
MGCGEEVHVASASAISAGWRTEGFVEFTVKCDAAVATFPCAYVDNQMVEKGLPLYRKSGEKLGEWVERDARLACVSTLSFASGGQFP